MTATGRRHRRRAALLQALWDEGERTRPQLATALGVSVPTATALVAELLEEGLLEDRGVLAAAGVGKPPAAVGLAASTNAVAVVDLSGGAVLTGAVVTLSGEIHRRRELPLRGRRGEEALEAVVTLAQELMATTPVRLVAVAVATPGVVDAEGTVRVSDRLGWRDLDLAGEVARATGLPAVVRNDVDALALGVRRYLDRSDRDLLVIALGSGIGASVVVGGRLLPGQRSAAGEIGHVRVDPEGEGCACGRRGCLELVVGAPHLGPAIAGEEAAGRERLLRRAGDALGTVLTPVVGVLDLEDVLVIGPSSLYGGAFLEALSASLAEGNLPELTAGLRVALRDEDRRIALLGATAAAIEAELGVR